MPGTTDFVNSVMALYFNGTAHADLAQNDTSGPATTLTLSLHTASPGVGGDMTANEASYTGYSRQPVTRGSGALSVSGGVVTFLENIDFPECTSGTETLTHLGIGTGTSDNLMLFGALGTTVPVSLGVIPRVKAGTTVTLT